jgi:GntR family carbon starvation induced transcriptional regulator
MKLAVAGNAMKKKAAPGAPPAGESLAHAQPRGTLASMAYERLRHEIINAQFPPGQKLHIGQLCNRYGIGLSPVREALNRLSRDGLVRQSDQRGFSVTPLSEAHLDELTKTRCWLYETALRESIAHGDEAWEEGVVLAYHRMSRIPRHLSEPDAIGYNPLWEEAHRNFHSSLIAACGSQWLMGFCEQLFDAADCYRHLSRVSSLRRSQRKDEHREIMEAVVSRNADKAVELLNAHFTRTADLVRDKLAALSRTATR